MFERLAKSRFVKFWPVRLLRSAPGPNWAVFANQPYSNDNLPGFRRPAATGQRRFPTPALACHWFDRDGRLECRWEVESGDGDVAWPSHNNANSTSATL